MKTRVSSGLIALFMLALSTCIPARAQIIFNNLHSFAFTNGTGPVANLIISGNTLYGTTRIYGGGDGGGDGSVFKLNTDGSGFTNMHTFSGYAPEPGNLDGGLVLAGSTLYGTAAFGGDLDHGCIFAMDTNGLGLINLYNFTTNAPNSTNYDGVYPSAGLLRIGNTLYGTANGGGAFNSGTLFSVNTNGSGFTNLHNFIFATGNYPGRDLIFGGGGMLYGTTGSGGSYGYGVIFKISTNGIGYTNFYSFTATSGPDKTNSDGAFPACSLVLSDTALYGTAAEGGDLGGGTIFKIDTSGTNVTVLHAFGNTNGVTGTNLDGARPKSGMVLVGTTLFGTTFTGGNSGSGTIFRINTDGTDFKTLYNFSGTNGVGPNGNGAGTNSDGAHPVGQLLYANSTLYGTATDGGDFGYGTVFSIFTAPTLTITLAGTNAILAWPSNAVGFNLEVATNLAGTWNPLAGQYSVTNPASGRQKFYRLKSP